MIRGNMKSVAVSLLLLNILHLSCFAGTVEAGIIIRNVNLIDGTGKDIQYGIDIGIHNGKIAEIAKTLQWNNTAKVIQGNSRFVIPGLIDTHVQLGATVLAQLSEIERDGIIRHTPRAFLFNGITTVLNVSSEDERIWEFRKAQRAGEVIVPRIYAMGSMFSPQGGWGYATGLPDAGGTVGYKFQGYNTPWELKLFVECGLTPMEALVAGTRNGAEVIGVENVLGTIEPDKFADMLILKSNPLDDIENIRDIDSVIQNGKIYERDNFEYKEENL